MGNNSIYSWEKKLRSIKDRMNDPQYCYFCRRVTLTKEWDCTVCNFSKTIPSSNGVEIKFNSPEDKKKFVESMDKWFGDNGSEEQEINFGKGWNTYISGKALDTTLKDYTLDMEAGFNAAHKQWKETKND